MQLLAIFLKVFLLCLAGMSSGNEQESTYLSSQQQRSEAPASSDTVKTAKEEIL
jgi:hypothetical protein